MSTKRPPKQSFIHTAHRRRRAQTPTVTITHSKPILTRKVIFHIIIVFGVALIPIWLFTPYINIISGQHSYSLSSYSITAIYQNNTDIISLIGMNDGRVLSLESSRVADPFTYNATHSFTSESTGKHSVTGWTTMSGSDDPIVINLLSNHAKVVNISNSKLSRSVQSFSTGVVEFWMYISPSSLSNTIFVNLSSDGVNIASIETKGLKLYVSNQIIDDTPYASVWYHFNIQIINGMADIIVNGVRVKSNIPIVSVDEISIGNGCFDAIGCSVDGYTVGNNILPLKQFSLRAEFIFSISLFAFIELSTSVRVSIDYHQIIGGSVYSMMYVAHGGEMYKMIDICDDIVTDGTMIYFTVGRYQSFLIQSRLSILMIQYSDFITSMNMDYLSILVNVII